MPASSGTRGRSSVLRSLRRRASRRVLRRLRCQGWADEAVSSLDGLYRVDTPGIHVPTALQCQCLGNIGAVFRELGPQPPDVKDTESPSEIYRSATGGRGQRLRCASPLRPRPSLRRQHIAGPLALPQRPRRRLRHPTTACVSMLQVCRASFGRVAESGRMARSLKHGVCTVAIRAELVEGRRGCDRVWSAL